MTDINRRQFIRLTSFLAGSVFVSTSLGGCASTPTPSDVVFSHGVASGDPTKNAVILWTRAVPLSGQSGSAVTINWEIANDEGFSDIVRKGSGSTSAAKDFTLKIDVKDLSPNTHYYYRFAGANALSVTGKTKTLPTGNVEQISFAVFSCSNYPAGYFNPYRIAAQMQDIDAVLHLGDYIYEYAADGYATENAEKIGRSPDSLNLTEVITLDNYRHRYALYRTDTGLQAIHAAAPFIAVWDDHEITNDTWKAGAQNHNEGEGDFIARQVNAVQAYYEWLPIRPPYGDSSPQIYRSFDFGNLLSLHMLDTRLIGRDKQLAYRSYMNEDGVMDVRRFTQDLGSKERTMLGKEQLKWLQTQISQSKGKWQILGQQVLMGKMRFPAELLSNQDLTKTAGMINQLATLKRRQQHGENLSLADTARLSQVMAYNLDAWDGYPAEREALYQFVSQQGKQLAVVAGDTHNAWCNRLSKEDGKTVGYEYATPGVSSPGMETYLSLSDAQAKQLADDLQLLIPDLEYCNLHQRGLLSLTITQNDIEANWLYVDTVLKPSTTIVNRHVIKQSEL
jgi:alkaline phosphatase D